MFSTRDLDFGESSAAPQRPLFNLRPDEPVRRKNRRQRHFRRLLVEFLEDRRLLSVEPVLSRFDTDMDGWTSSPEVTWANSGGNPGGYLQFTDAVGGPTWIYAPPKFLGSWESYASFSWDHAYFGTGAFQPQVTISGTFEGAAARATWWPDSIPGPVDWRPHVVDLKNPDFSHMAIVGGSGGLEVWRSILNDVSGVKILIDASTTFAANVEGVDNVLLTPTSYTTEIALDGDGNLSITDIGGGDTDDALVIKTDGADLVVRDSAGNLLGVAGLDPGDYSGHNSEEVRIRLDAAGWTGSLIIDTLSGDDSVTFQTSATNLGGRSLDVNSQTIAVSAPIDSAGGDVSLSATGDVTLNEPVTTGGGAFVAHADRDGDGAGTFTVATAALGAWSQQQKLTADGEVYSRLLGRSVSLSGDTALVGAPWDNPNGPGSGSAYVFVRSGGTWTQQAKLTASDGSSGDAFGYSVSLSGDTALVGAETDSSTGSAYVFTRSGRTWTQQAKLTAPDAALDDYFGRSVAVSGDTALIGAWSDEVNGVETGSAYVFTRSGGVWSERASLTAADGLAADAFGFSVALSGDTALVGAPWSPNGTASGAAYTFQDSPGTTASSIATSGGAVTITAADVVLAGTIDAGTGAVTLRPSTNGRTFDLGAAGGSGQIVLTDEELDLVATADKIVVGDALTGNVTITGEVTPASAHTLEIISGATISDAVGNIVALSGGIPYPAPGNLMMIGQRIDLQGSTISADCSVTIRASQGIRLGPGGSITANAADCGCGVTLEASGTTPGSYVGVELDNATVTTDVGFINIFGHGGDSGPGNHGVSIHSGSVVQAGGCCDVMVTGTGGASSGNDNDGVRVVGSGSKITSSGGDVTVRGTGGGAGASADNDGVFVATGGAIMAGATPGQCCGEVTVTGIGGLGSGDYNEGVDVQGGGEITSSGGNVTVCGWGRGSGGGRYNVGTDVNGGRITAGGRGTVTVCGRGGITSGSQSHGVLVRNTGALITSSGGDVLVCGTAGSGSSGTYAVALANGAAIGDSIAMPTVRIAATGEVWENASSRIVADALGIVATNPNGRVSLDSGPNDVNILAIRADGYARFGDADGYVTGTVSGVAGPDGCCCLCAFPETTGVTSQVGVKLIATGPSGAIDMEPDAEIRTLGAIELEAPGGVTVSRLVTIGDVTILTTGGTIANAHAVGPNIVAATAMLEGNVAPGGSPGIFGVEGDAVIAAGETFTVEIGGTTPGDFDGNHDQLSATGGVTIEPGVTLDTMAWAGFVPSVGDTFTIIERSGGSGTFNGLPEGAHIDNFLGSGLYARISYAGGDGDDVVLNCVGNAVTVYEFPWSIVEVELGLPDGTSEVIALQGTTTAAADWDGPEEGDAIDEDTTIEDEIEQELKDLLLKGISPTRGPVDLKLHPTLPALGEIEETANLITGMLDLPPFGAAGTTADSYFDIYFQVDVAGQTLYSAQPKRLSAQVTYTPAGLSDVFVSQNGQSSELVDANGTLSGYSLGPMSLRFYPALNPEFEPGTPDYEAAALFEDPAERYSDLGFDLLKVYFEYQHYLAEMPGIPFRPSNELLLVADGLILADAVAATDASGLIGDLESLPDAQVLGSYQRLVSVWVKLESLLKLVDFPSLLFAQPGYLPVTSYGAVDSQGDIAMRADLARGTYTTVDGSAITVGVLSNSVNQFGNGLMDSSGEIAFPVNVRADVPSSFCTFYPELCTDEGRAMLEIVQDVAPQATLAFATGFPSQVVYRQNILDLAQHADLLVDDLMYLTEPMYLDGMVARAVDEVVAGGVPYFSAAGNQARQSYEAAFHTGEFSWDLGGWLHDFAPSQHLQPITIPNGVTAKISFQWEDTFASLGCDGAQRDLDFYVLDALGNPLTSGQAKNKDHDPVEVHEYKNTSGQAETVYVAIVLAADTPFDLPDPPDRIKYVIFQSPGVPGVTIDQWNTSSPTTYGHANAAGAEAVGAAFYNDTPVHGQDPPTLEPFSSAGGVPILFGQSCCAGPQEPLLRRTPDLVGPDGGDTSFFGRSDPFPDGDYEANNFPNFFGTSAAAPHVAGVAALLMEAAGGPGSLSPQQVYSILEQTAVDMDDPQTKDDLGNPLFDQGFDYATGYGFVDAKAALDWLEDSKPNGELATPVVTMDVPDCALVNETFEFTVTFDNGSNLDMGYGPFIDVVLQFRGADGERILAGGTPKWETSPRGTPDGLGAPGTPYWPPIVNVQYDIPPIFESKLIEPVKVGTQIIGLAEHPFAVDANGEPLKVQGEPGDLLVSVLLPYGSFAWDQPSATLKFEVHISEEADLGEPLYIRARGGFRYGFGYVDGPSYVIEPEDSSTWAEQFVTPTVMRISKWLEDAPENETATGPNFPVKWNINVDIAKGQTINNLVIVDDLPSEVVFLPPPTIPPGFTWSLVSGELRVSAPGPILGTASTTDVQMQFQFYVPDILGPCGEPLKILNVARAEGTWEPKDDRDGPSVNALSCPCQAEDLLTARSIAVQKSVGYVTDDDGNPDLRGTNVTPALDIPASVVPDQVLEYELRFQISDYFAFGHIVVNDWFSDGQEYICDAYPPRLEITTNNGDTYGTVFECGVHAVYTPDPGLTSSTLGIQGEHNLLFDVSNQLVATWGSTNPDFPGGILSGGLFHPASANDGPTTGVIRFRTRVLDAYQDFQLGVDASLNEHDELSNRAEIGAAVMEYDPDMELFLHTPCDRATDGTALPLRVPEGTFEKSVYATTSGTSWVAPLDDVTFRLTYDLKTGVFEKLILRDFLPHPIFLADDPAVNSSAWTIGSGLTAGTWKVTPAALPVSFSVQKGSNSIQWDFGTYSDTNNPISSIEILFTVKATCIPYADGLYLTNQGVSTHQDTHLHPLFQTDLDQIISSQPVLEITKGIVAADNPDARFTDPDNPAIQSLTPNLPTGVTYGPLGFSWPITSASLVPSGKVLNNNVTGVDACDIVTFVLLVENTGSSKYGAFDVEIRDDLPDAGCLRIPDSGLELTVHRGDGSVIGYVGLGGGPDNTNGTDDDLFGNGIKLLNQSSTLGSLEAGTGTSGRNLAVITFKLQVCPDVEPPCDLVHPCHSLTDWAYLDRYAGAEDCPHNHVDAGFAKRAADDAWVIPAQPTIVKEIVSTDQAHTVDPRVTIGERVTFSVVITVPEGTSSDVKFVDQFLDELGRGTMALTNKNLVTIQKSSPKLTWNGSGTVSTVNGTSFSIDFGTVKNEDCDNSVDETITITYTAVVLNTTYNDSRGELPCGCDRSTNECCDRLTNDATWQWTVISDEVQSIAVSEGIDEWWIAGVKLFPNATAAEVQAALEGQSYYQGNVVVTGNAGGPWTIRFRGNLADRDVPPIPLTYCAVTPFGTICGSGGSTEIVKGGEVLSVCDVHDSVELFIVEPNIQIEKSVVPEHADAGDVVRFTITITNPGSLFNPPFPCTSDAFELLLEDWISECDCLTIIGNVVEFSPTGSYPTSPPLSWTGKTISAGWDIFPVDGCYTVSFDALLGDCVVPCQELDNEAVATWTSLPGLPGKLSVHNPLAVERTGDPTDPGGVANDYRDSDTATVKVPCPAVEKRIAATSEPDTGPVGGVEQVMIGEIVRFCIGVDLPEGSAPDFQIWDVLPEGFKFLDDGSVSVSYTSPIVGLDPPTIETFGQLVIFTMGDLVNTNNPSTTDVTLCFNALVTNTTTANAGQTVSNWAHVLIEGSKKATSNQIDLTIVEPRLEVEKTVEAVVDPAGQTILIYTITVTNIGSAPAFEVEVSDPLWPSTWTAKRVDPQDSKTFVYELVTDDCCCLTNHVEVTWTSLPDMVGTSSKEGEPNYTGSVVTGNPGASNGERNGSDGPGGVNDYVAWDELTLGSCLTGIKFEDGNADGIRNVNEPGLAGWIIELYRNGVLVASAVTDSQGRYRFAGICPGEYEVREVIQPGWTQTAPSSGSYTVVVGNQGTITDLDFGNALVGCLGDFVWHDADGDGVQDGGELGLPYLKVVATWHGPNGDVTYETTTDAAGSYQFQGLPLGQYTVTVALNSLSPGHIPTFDLDGGFNASTSVTLDADDPCRHDVDFGFAWPGTICVCKFEDLNRNGQHDQGEPPLAGVQIVLTGVTGTGQAVGPLSGTTDADGRYCFTDLAPGSYTIDETVSGMTPTTPLPVTIDLKSRELVSGCCEINPPESDLNMTISLVELDDPDPDDPAWLMIVNAIDSAPIIITADGSDVLVNGFRLLGFTSALSDIVANGSSAANLIDLSGVTAANFPAIQTVTINGGDGDDTIIGSELSDVIDGGPGDDRIFGGPGDDAIWGGEGNDRICGGPGNDALQGNAGNDLISGGDGDDAIWGGTGNDGLAGNEGDDSLYGEEDNDTLLGEGGDDALDGGSGDDVLLGGDGADFVDGGEGADLVAGGGNGSAADPLDVVVVVAGEDLPREDWFEPVWWAYCMQDTKTCEPRLAFGNVRGDIGNFFLGAIVGFKFDDRDGDGVYEPEECERKVPYVEIFLDIDYDKDGNIDQTRSTLTDINGEYRFTDLASGFYFVRERVPGFATQVTVDPPRIELLSGDLYVALAGMADDLLDEHHAEIVQPLLAFGNRYDGYGAIRGCKFIDRDGDGVRDDGELPLAGVTFNLYVLDPHGDFQLYDTTVTSSTGAFCFMNLWPGTYRLEELPLPGSVATTPLISDLVIGPGDVISFGECAVAGSIHGFKYEDMTANGVYDPGIDRPWPGVLITLEGDVNGDGVSGDVLTTRTDENGEFSFPDLFPGPYTLSETPPGGSLPSTAQTRQINVESGQELVAFAGQAMLNCAGCQQEVVVGEDLMFGNFCPGSIHGIKYWDVNANGLYDPLIDGVAGGVTITLTGDVNGDGTPDTVNQVTDANGEYGYTGLYPGTYTVEETPVAGSQPTTPTSYTVVVHSGEELVALPGQARLLGEDELRIEWASAFSNWNVPDVADALHLPDDKESNFEVVGQPAATPFATFHGFGTGFSSVVKVADLAALLHVEEAVVRDADFVAFEYNGASPDPSKNDFETCEWEFSDGLHSFVISHVHYQDPGPGAFVSGVIGNQEYADFFGFANIRGTAGNFAYLIVDVDRYSLVNPSALSFQARLTADGVDGSSPDVDAMGRFRHEDCQREVVLGPDLAFGNYVPPENSISVRKWYDRNADGERQENEQWLNGWHILIEDPTTGTLLAQCVTHDVDVDGDLSIDPETESGWCRFENVPPGTYTVREEVRPGWVAVNPASGERIVTVSSGQASVELYFGNTLRHPAQIRLQVADAAGEPITMMYRGQSLFLEGYVEDLREHPEGVFSAYLDVLYDATLVSVDGPIEYGADYSDGQSGSTAVAGVINEVGAFDGQMPLGSGEFLLFRVPFHADAVGRIDFIPNEAEALEHEVLLYGGSEPVPPEDVQFVGVSLGIYHAPWQNPTNRFDVSGDGRVTPLDVLLIINEINSPYWSNGLGPLPVPPPPGKIPFYDVNGDGLLGPIDVLAVINEINSVGVGGGEGEFAQTWGLASWLFAPSSFAAAAPLPATGSRQLADPVFAVRSTTELACPAPGSQGDELAVLDQAEADRHRVALLQCLGGSADEDTWEQFSPFELEETLVALGEDLGRGRSIT